MDEKPREFSPPYLPWKTFFNFLDRLAEEGAPDRIDRSFLRSMDGQTQSYLMGALKGFGLMSEEGRVEEALGPLVAKDTRQEAVGALLARFYPRMVALPSNATQLQLDETFRPYQMGADATRKAQTFFLRAASYAGVSLSPHFKNPAAAPGEGGARTGTRKPATRRRRNQSNLENPPPPPPPVDSGADRGGAGTLNVHPMLQGSMLWLSQSGPSWSEAMAEAWISSFVAQVKLVYPPKRQPRPNANPRTRSGTDSENEEAQ